ncbi:LysR substrate-binding domain-containing protein [Rhizobium leguminosarum]|uniref:LysR substrate-binding domain-containing protein n=1 Tax=Rhizobium leguminosarum TaxID=384 RepID=UPI0013C00852|nr:LysR family transcriptional regulator [Rhizobium ruizarguesonis]NEJ33883.1 LysR family transcriptional regulator [Rhizobium ruizarguesonis]
MNLTIRQLRYVCEVARRGSVQAASKALLISQSSILAAITLAEGEMGARIFERRPARGVQITPAGERFVSAARVMLSAETEFNRAIGDLTDRVPKVLRIGCFEPFGALFMPEMLRRYVHNVGDVEIDLLEGNQVQLQAWLAEGLIDFAILYDIGSIHTGSITRICKVPAHAVLHTDDPLAGEKAVWLSDISSRPFVLLDMPQTATYLLTLFDILAQRPKVGFHTRSYETVRSAVASGFGMSILNMRPIGQATADCQTIIRLPILDELPPPTVIILDLYGNAKPLFVRLFVEIFKKFFHDIGPSGFSVTTPERESSLMPVR